MTTDQAPPPDLAQNLPLLRSEYLKSHPATPAFWSTWGQATTWTATFCPVYEWQGLLFIGCSTLENLASFHAPADLTSKIVFVLCEPEALNSFYIHAQALTLEQAPLATPQPAPLAEIPTLAAPATTSAPSDDPFAGLEMAEESKISNSSSDNEFSLELKDDADETGEGSADEPAAEMLDLGEQIPEGFTLTPAVPNPLAALTSAEPSISEVTTTPVAVIDSENTISAFPQPQAGTPLQLDQLTKNLFQEMKSHFIKSMLFKKEGNALTAWKWDSEFHPQKGIPDSPISLGIPSPFRIVSRTLKPYHGYLIQNEVSDKFFEDWNDSQIPDHLTIYPIVVGDQLVGALLGIAEKSVNQKAALNLAHRVASEVEASMAQDPQLMAS